MPQPPRFPLSAPVEKTNHIHARMIVESGRLREHPHGGIVLDAGVIDIGESRVALALIADLSGLDGGRNVGMSATNALGTIISTYQQDLLAWLDVSDVVWVELDSMGCFDLVMCQRDRIGSGLNWHPLTSGLHPGRTEADFTLLYGAVAVRAMAKVRQDVASTSAGAG